MPEAHGGRAAHSSLRYPTIDILRGLALVSMISYHVTNLRLDTVIGHVTHIWRWVDGAFLFVALSGLVAGLVHRRVVEARGTKVSVHKLLRRAAFLYAVHIALTMVTILLHTADHHSGFLDTPSLTSANAANVLSSVMLMRLQPNFNDVLPMYVLFLCWAAVAVVLLHRGRWWVVAGISLAVYLCSQTIGGLELAPGRFDLAGWQLLFTGGLLVGWTWEHERTRVTLSTRRAIVAMSAASTFALLGLARLPGKAAEPMLGKLIGKFNGGAVAFAYAAVLIVTGYAVINWLLQQPAIGRYLGRLAILGRKGLPGYVAMVAALTVLDLVPQLPRDDLTILAVIAISGATEVLAVRFDGWRKARADVPAPALLALPPPVPDAIAS